MERFLPLIGCLVGIVLVLVLMRVGAKRATAGWAWFLVVLFFAAVVVEVISMCNFGTSAKESFSTVPRQKAQGD
jgi:hypothetical protein